MPASWNQFDYGPLAHQIAEYWIPDNGTNRACVVYCPGGGWSTSSQRAFYDANVGKPLFLEHIEPDENVSGREIVCISMMYGMAYQDFNNDAFGSEIAWESWDSGTSYTRGDVRAYNPSGISSWTLQGPPSYSIGDLVQNDTGVMSKEIFECILNHTPNGNGSDEPGEGNSWETYWVSLGTSNERRSYECVQSYSSPLASAEPVVGAAWQDYWRVMLPNNVGNAGEVVGGGDVRKTASVPTLMSEGIRDVQTMVQFLKANAEWFGINPNKIVLYGDSAGGSTCGTAAYSNSKPFSARISRVDADHLEAREVSAGMNWKTPISDSSVLGLILEITPSDYRWFGAGDSLHGRNLFGVDHTQTTSAADIEYELIPNEIRASVSPLGALKATGNAIPTFLHYYGSQVGDTYDINNDLANPPWEDLAPYHHARNGYFIQQELLRLGMDAADCPFYDESDAVTGTTLGQPNIGPTMHTWLLNLIGY